jgi:hypothetical protein
MYENKVEIEVQPEPWWLQADEECSVCGDVYVYEQAYYCVGCDGAICAGCVHIIGRSRLSYCRGCRPNPKRKKRS